MKELVAKQKRTQITVDDLTGREFVIYQSKSRGEVNNFCFLVRLNVKGENNKFGFISLDDVGSPARYVGTSMSDSIQKVSETGRRVFIFDKSKEMINFIHNVKEEFYNE